MTSAYTLSEAAQRAGATVHQVRTYVTAGLVRPCTTTPGGYFMFDEACVEGLRLIAAATRAGLRIADISPLVKALDTQDPRALRAARQSVLDAIGSRQAALQQLDALVGPILSTAAKEARHELSRKAPVGQRL
ncbi:MAG: MerR family transcriptional regulator [Acidobacteria bacterium]|nr:MerR family transcriptional regulator [Acidobacteriota bacterium]